MIAALALDLQSIGVFFLRVSFHYHGVQAISFVLHQRPAFEQKKQSGSALWGVLSPFSFLYPMSRCCGPGHKLLFHKRDYWIPTHLVYGERLAAQR